MVFAVLWVVGRFQTWYFSKPDVVARRATRAKLPPTLQMFEMLVFACWLALFLAATYGLFFWVNGMVHPTSSGLSSRTITASWNSVFDFLKLFPEIFISAPLAMILANATAWVFPSIRRMEAKAAEGVPGASFKEATTGLVKLSLVIVPVSIALIAIGILAS